MTITIKKAGEQIASKVISTAGKAAVAGAPTRPVGAPRAIGKKEAAQFIPAKESTKSTMMPWRGWIDRFLQDKLDKEQYAKFRDTFYFMPNDPYNLQQMPMASAKIPVSADGKTQASIREVSPGSQPPVDIPLHELDDDPYDSKYFSKDTRRRFIDPEFPHPDIEQIKLDMQDPDDPEVQEAKKKLAAGPTSSKGNGCRFATGPSDFDPTGLRAVMAVTHAAIKKEMDKHMPNHLPEPVWTKNEEELFNWYKERDLPVPIGGNWNFARKSRRVARW